MRIGIDVRAFESRKAGIGTYVESLLDSLGSVDHINEYYLYSNKAIPVSLPKNFVKRVINIPSFLWHVIVYFDILLKDVDIYHSTHSLIIPILPGVNCVLTIHDLTGVLFPDLHSVKVKLIYKFLLRMAVFRVKKIIVPSESTKKDLLGFFKVSPLKIVVITETPRQIFKTEISEAEKSEVAIRYKTTDPFLLFVSTLEPRKNIGRLIEAFEMVSKTRPSLKLLIVGKKGWLYDQIFQKVEARGLTEKVVFLGYVTDHDLSVLYSLCEVFVFPSLYEGFGLTPLEAMCRSSVVVASSTSSFPESLDGGAIFCDPYSVSDIAAKIELALSDKVLRENLKVRALSHCLTFEGKIEAQKTLAVYEESHA